MPFELQPYLVGELVELRPLRLDDFDALYAAASDPLIWEQHPENDRWKPDVFQRFFDGAMESGGAFAVVEREGEEVVGSSRYHDYNAERSDVEIGWTFLAWRCWGGWYNGEMKRLMLDHAFRFVQSVKFIIGPDNIRSQRAVEKIGGVRDGARTEPDGQANWVYRISRSTWRRD